MMSIFFYYPGFVFILYLYILKEFSLSALKLKLGKKMPKHKHKLTVQEWINTLLRLFQSGLDL